MKTLVVDQHLKHEALDLFRAVVRSHMPGNHWICISSLWALSLTSKDFKEELKIVRQYCIDTFEKIYFIAIPHESRQQFISNGSAITHDLTLHRLSHTPRSVLIEKIKEQKVKKPLESIVHEESLNKLNSLHHQHRALHLLKTDDQSIYLYPLGDNLTVQFIVFLFFSIVLLFLLYLITFCINLASDEKEGEIFGMNLNDKNNPFYLFLGCFITTTLTGTIRFTIPQIFKALKLNQARQHLDIIEQRLIRQTQVIIENLRLPPLEEITGAEHGHTLQERMSCLQRHVISHFCQHQNDNHLLTKDVLLALQRHEWFIQECYAETVTNQRTLPDELVLSYLNLAQVLLHTPIETNSIRIKNIPRFEALTFPHNRFSDQRYSPEPPSSLEYKESCNCMPLSRKQGFSYHHLSHLFYPIEENQQNDESPLEEPLLSNHHIV